MININTTERVVLDLLFAKTRHNPIEVEITEDHYNSLQEKNLITKSGNDYTLTNAGLALVKSGYSLDNLDTTRLKKMPINVLKKHILIAISVVYDADEKYIDSLIKLLVNTPNDLIGK